MFGASSELASVMEFGFYSMQPVVQPTTDCMFVYTTQPVVQPTVACIQTFNRLSYRFDNGFDNRLYRVNGVLKVTSE